MTARKPRKTVGRVPILPPAQEAVCTQLDAALKAARAGWRGAVQAQPAARHGSAFLADVYPALSAAHQGLNDAGA